jgi:hypothetical protein
MQPGIKIKLENFLFYQKHSANSVFQQEDRDKDGKKTSMYDKNN